MTAPVIETSRAHGRPGPGWPAYDTARRATMLLGRECGGIDAPLAAEPRFWETT